MVLLYINQYYNSWIIVLDISTILTLEGDHNDYKEPPLRAKLQSMYNIM